MTAVAAAAAPPPVPVTPASMSAVAAAAIQPASTNVVPQPAVVLNIAGSATSTTPPTPINATPAQVSNSLGVLSMAQGMLFIYEHTDWNKVYQQGGEAGVKKAVANFAQAIGSESAYGSYLASGLGIKVQSTIALPTATSPIITGSITVAPFTFSSQGSTYTVSTTANGNAVGTKDGQPWQPWGLGPPATDLPSTVPELLALLTSFENTSAATNSGASTSHAKVDMSV